MSIFEEPLFQALFGNAAPRIILKADVPNFTIVTYNKSYEEATHTQTRNIRGQYLWDAFDPNEAGGSGGQVLSDALVKACETAEHVHMPPFHYDIPSADATHTVESWWQLEIVPVRGIEGRVEYLLTTTHNITEQVLLNRSVEAGIQREQSLSETLAAANEELKASNEELSANMEELKAAHDKLEFLKNSLEETVISRTKSLVDRERDLQAAVEELAASNEELLATNDQLEKTIEEKIVLEGVLRTNERILKNTIVEHEFLANNVPPVVWTSRPDGSLDFINQRWYEQSGRTVEETLGIAWVDALHPDDKARAGAAWALSLQSGDPYEIEFRTINRNGDYRWNLIRALPLRDEEGRIIKWYGTNTDIEEQKRLERQKDDFLAVVSHELKTPVTSIKAYTQIVENMLRSGGNTKHADMMQKMDKQVSRLNSLIGDLLDITKINAGKLTLSHSPFDFNKLAEEVVEYMQPTSFTHKIEMRLHFTGSVTGDRDRVSQVITNLISNAIKYSPDAKRIVVYTENNENEAMLCVQDFGIGINRDKQDRVFEQFYRVSGTKEHIFPGMGLGLFISSEIVKRMEGRIWVNSVEGKGSTFCFAMPNSDAK